MGIDGFYIKIVEGEERKKERKKKDLHEIICFIFVVILCIYKYIARPKVYLSVSLFYFFGVGEVAKRKEIKEIYEKLIQIV